MPDTDLIRYIDTRINDCGTADDIADIAARLKATIDYLSQESSGWRVDDLRQAYRLLLGRVSHHAGLSLEEYALLDDVLDLRNKSSP